MNSLMIAYQILLSGNSINNMDIEAFNNELLETVSINISDEIKDINSSETLKDIVSQKL